MVWLTRRTAMRVHCEKTSLYTTFWLTWTNVFAWKCSHRSIQLVTQFPMLCSTDMFPRTVLTTRRVHVHVRTLRDGCVHTFFTYEVMSMRNFKHITPCLSHNFPQVHSKQSTTSRFFNLWTLLTMQLLTYKNVSVCKLSHKDVSVCNVWQNF